MGTGIFGTPAHRRPPVTPFASCGSSQFKRKLTLPKRYEISGFHFPVPFLTQASETWSNHLEESKIKKQPTKQKPTTNKTRQTNQRQTRNHTQQPLPPPTRTAKC